jgi:dienelactone hydrolase
LRFLALPLLCHLLFSCGCPCAKRVEPARPEESRFGVLPVPGYDRVVNVTKSHGKPVLLLHEVLGQSPACLDLALEMEREGAKVYVPRLFNGYGHVAKKSEWIPKLVFNRYERFNLYGGTDLGPVRGDMRMILNAIRRDCPGQPITVIGNCMTGAIPLEFLADRDVETVVLCQPTVPIFSKRKFGMPEEAVEASFEAMEKTRRKRIISFNYLSDGATIGKTFALAQRSSDHGVADRHLLYIGVLPGAKPGKKAPTWHAGWRELKVCDGRGHSTITATGNGRDLREFRKALFRELGLKGRG